MPSTSYGRGGGNYQKKPKPPKSKPNANEVDGVKSNEKVSLLKKIALVLPGTQSRKSGLSATSQPNGLDGPSQGPRPWELYADPLSPSPTNNSSLPPTLPRMSVSSQTPSYPFVIDINGQPARPNVNLNSVTPSSSDDESEEFEQRARAFSSVDILPFSSTHTVDTERTAVNDVYFPSRDAFQTLQTSGSLPGRLRSRSLSDNSPARNVHFKPEPIGANPRTDRMNPSGSEGNASSAAGRHPRGDGRHTRGRGMTLAASVPTPSIIRRRPVSVLNPVVHWNPPPTVPQPQTGPIASTPASGGDSFNHLLISCAISLLLLLILALGKDALYILALLPVIVTLGKHFLDAGKLGLNKPFRKQRLESLLSF